MKKKNIAIQPQRDINFWPVTPSPRLSLQSVFARNSGSGVWNQSCLAWVLKPGSFTGSHAASLTSFVFSVKENSGALHFGFGSILLRQWHYIKGVTHACLGTIFTRECITQSLHSLRFCDTRNRDKRRAAMAWEYRDFQSRGLRGPNEKRRKNSGKLKHDRTYIGTEQGRV